MSEEADLFAALRAAGVNLDQIEEPDNVYGALYEYPRPDLGQSLYFARDPEIEEWHSENWTWELRDDEEGVGLSDGWEPDVASMVARVVAFLGTGKP